MDDLAKQRKKEHEEMYPWYVYQPTRSDKSKKGKKDPTMAAVVPPAVGKASKEKESKKERMRDSKIFVYCPLIFIFTSHFLSFSLYFFISPVKEEKKKTPRREEGKKGTTRDGRKKETKDNF